MAKTNAFDDTVKFRDSRHEALVGVWWTGQILRKHANRFFRRHGSTDVQFNILVQLDVEGRALTQQELSDRLFVDKSNLTGVAGRMEAAGLIARLTDKTDKRAYRVRLTPAGRRALAGMEAPYRAEVRRVMAGFSEGEAGELTGMMRRMRLSVRRLLAAGGKEDG